MRGRAPQVHPLRHLQVRHHGRILGKPGLAPGTSQEDRRTRAAPQFTAQQGQQAAVRIGRRTPLAVEHQQAGAGPQRAQGRGIAAQGITAIQAGVGECEAFQPGRRPHGHGAAAQTVKLLPQPQVVLALGLRITNCAPPRPSL